MRGERAELDKSAAAEMGQREEIPQLGAQGKGRKLDSKETQKIKALRQEYL